MLCLGYTELGWEGVLFFSLRELCDKTKILDLLTTLSRNLLPNSAFEKGRAPPAQWAQQLQQKREGSGVARTTHTSHLTESTNQWDTFNYRDYFPLLPGGEEISKGLF